ncbi:MAG: nitrogenase component 1 [Deltaproteobacteria bacterium]|nr:nitrogenase component 1 [Deltaproteobacteria bacterium]
MKINKMVRKFSQRLINPYMVGIYLGVNAIKDFYLVVDGPDCSYMKTQYITLNHDFYANLTNLSGFHRVGNTALHPFMMADSREESILKFIEKIASQPFTKVIGITPMPMAAVTAVDYKRLLNKISTKYKKPTFEFKNKSLSGDWMDGYSEFAKVLASEMTFKRRLRGSKSIGIIGYLFDRNEYDNFANISELRRIFGEIGVDISSIWFSGGSYDDLCSISNSSLLISFGYMEEAAKIISERLKIPLMKADYPIGFEQTAKLIRDVADYFRIKSVNRVIENEIRTVVRRIEPLVEQHFLGLNVVYCGDPIIFMPLKKSLELLGANFSQVVISNTLDKKRYLEQFDGDILFEPTINKIIDICIRLAKTDKIDLYVGNSDASSYFIASGKATVELGFPSYFSHSIYDEPYLGFRGFLSLINRIVKELRYHEVRTVYQGFFYM